ncbi:MAG: GxxExxY protein [Gemmatimonadota bacterium]
MTYMKLTDCKVGLIINFKAPTFKQAVKRLIL